MTKQIFLITLLSVVTIMFKDQIAHVLNALVYAHDKIAGTLHVIFSDDRWGRLIQDMIALLLIPVFCGIVVALVFWLVKRSKMPHMMAVVWVVWLALLITMVAHTNVANAQPEKSTIQNSEG